jgi:hypothetical protein
MIFYFCTNGCSQNCQTVPAMFSVYIVPKSNHWSLFALLYDIAQLVKSPSECVNRPNTYATRFFNAYSRLVSMLWPGDNFDKHL